MVILCGLDMTYVWFKLTGTLMRMLNFQMNARDCLVNGVRGEHSTLLFLHCMSIEFISDCCIVMVLTWAPLLSARTLSHVLHKTIQKSKPGETGFWENLKFRNSVTDFESFRKSLSRREIEAGLVFCCLLLHIFFPLLFHKDFLRRAPVSINGK